MKRKKTLQERSEQFSKALLEPRFGRPPSDYERIGRFVRAAYQAGFRAARK